jgi:5-methyltetrahydrofolate--homocysteine methyltransferase
VGRGKAVLEEIAEKLVELNSEEVQSSIREALDAGFPPQEIIQVGLGKGMETVGGRYEKGDYFLSELIMAATIMNEGMEILYPHLKGETLTNVGEVIIGTVEGDLHDIGKNIVVSMLESAGFKVFDLGIDVTPARFVEGVRENSPDLVCMSTLLSVTMLKVKETIDKLEEAGLRNTVKILVGGRCLNEKIASEMGADAFGRDAWDAVNKARQLLDNND